MEVIISKDVLTKIIDDVLFHLRDLWGAFKKTPKDMIGASDLDSLYNKTTMRIQSMYKEINNSAVSFTKKSSNIEVNPAATIMKGLELLQDELKNGEAITETLVMLRETAWDLVEWLRVNQVAGGMLPLPWTEWKQGRKE